MKDLSPYSEASTRYGVSALAKNLLPLLGLYALAPVLAAKTTVLAWGVTPFVGLLLYRLTLVMHDCGHGTLFATRQANVWVGRVMGYVTGIDFHAFQRRHAAHHRNYGEPDDPQGFQYLHLPRFSRPGLLWHSVKPLFGLNLPHVFQESVLAPGNLRSMFRKGEIFLLVAVQGVIAVIITGGGQFPTLILLPPFGAATVGLFLSQLRGIAEHGQRAANRGGYVRSHRAGYWGRLLLYDLNFNFHREHHLHPGVPSCHLPALARVLGDAEAQTTPATLKTLWKSV